VYVCVFLTLDSGYEFTRLAHKATFSLVDNEVAFSMATRMRVLLSAIVAELSGREQSFEVRQLLRRAEFLFAVEKDAKTPTTHLEFMIQRGETSAIELAGEAVAILDVLLDEIEDQKLAATTTHTDITHCSTHTEVHDKYRHHQEDCPGKDAENHST
jgi:hypothetical protein